MFGKSGIVTPDFFIHKSEVKQSEAGRLRDEHYRARPGNHDS